ncbi:acetyltransferase protein [Purpureocillium lavendulum]|uniref:Acetyltransferase protein n=1 Tax=Purpureocillium lavendulum TaxID=1247861 RepID=A0AB34FWI5_9HYPO|nr:acetyltransferase protein [Purpureocillium lavendulum]
MTVTPLVFRPATADDAAAVLALVRSAYRGESSRAGWTTEADLVADERIDADGVLAKINHPSGVVLVAHDADGRLAGCCELLRKDDALAYFGLFAVYPARQAGGLGRSILANAEQHAKTVWGVARIEMCVIWPRQELIAWYLRRGYRKTDRTLPFPYAHLVNGKALRDDLYFTVLDKEL